MINFGMIGTGWRAEFYLRIVAACSDRFQVAGLIGRNAEKPFEYSCSLEWRCQPTHSEPNRNMPSVSQDQAVYQRFE
jgi:predicted dehydrogenase